MTYRELYTQLKNRVEAKAAIYNPLAEKIVAAKGFLDLEEFFAYIKVEGEWITAERQFLQYEAQIEANGANLDTEIDVKTLYPYIDVKL